MILLGVTQLVGCWVLQRVHQHQDIGSATVNFVPTPGWLSR
jgi:hypothetical protein